MNAFAKAKQLKENKQTTYLPQEVVEKVTVEGKSLVRAWREYRNMSREETATRMGVTQPVYNVLEDASNRVSSASIRRLAAALGVSEKQLVI